MTELGCRQCWKHGKQVTFQTEALLNEHLVASHNLERAGVKEERKREAGTKRESQNNSPNLFAPFTHRRVKVTLLNGQSFEGEIKQVGTYDLLFSNERTEILIPKHALVSVEFVKN